VAYVYLNERVNKLKLISVCKIYDTLYVVYADEEYNRKPS
jgi:hypothetical protein